MSQPKHLATGRKRYDAQRRRDAIDRVRAFERWLARGSKGRVPVIPSDNDYRVARNAGAVSR